MARHDNQKVLENGFAEAFRMFEDTVVNSLIASMQQMFAELPQKIEYSGFTGQTQTSYMGGVYIGGRLRYLVTEKAWTRHPVRGKMPKDATWFLANPYEGKDKLRTGHVDITNPSGRATSLAFLQSYNAPSNRICAIVTTGTEYSTFLEEYLHLNVLTQTKIDAPKILDMNWKKIDKAQSL